MLLLTAASHAGPNPQWGAIQKYIAIQSGTNISAWSLPGRADITETQYGIAGATMTPVGDGTYSLGAALFGGNQYNYTFFANVNGYTYYDTVRNDGSSSGMVISSSPNTLQNPGTGSDIYTPVAGGDARRLLTVPTNLALGATVYVLNNFGGAPQVPTNIQSVPGQSTILLQWNEPATPWGNSGSMRPIDVLVGGGFRVFRSTNLSLGYQDIGASLAPSGQTTMSNGLISGTTNAITYQVLDTNPIPQTTNYYVIVSSDAYTGSGTDMNIGNLTSGVPGIGTAWQVKGRTGRPVEIWFKVEGADEQKIKENDSIVWLTPQDKDGRFYTHKIPGRMIAVYLPADDDEEGLIQILDPEAKNKKLKLSGYEAEKPNEIKIPLNPPLEKGEIVEPTKKAELPNKAEEL